MSNIDLITSPEVIAPGGHYSHATTHNGLVYVSGQLPIRPDGSRECGGIEAQTGVVLTNLEKILQTAGSSRNHLLKVVIYLASVELWGDVNRIYADFLGDWRPARSVVPVPALHHGFLIELDAIAAVS